MSNGIHMGNLSGDCSGGQVGLPDLEVVGNAAGGSTSILSPPPLMPPTLSAYTISDSNSHCLRLSEKLRFQREQARFADLILSVKGREFPAHRCVLAACSSWFDSKLKVHKCTREYIEIDQCKDYEIFYALLTYCYTGQIVLNDANVAELLHLSNYYGMIKLKSNCCAYLGQRLSVKTVHTVLDQALKYQVTELTKQALSFLQRHFTYILNHQKSELMNYPYNTIQAFLVEKGWSLPQEVVLKLIADWVDVDVANREDWLIPLLEHVNFSLVNVNFIYDHIDNEPLYNNPNALYNILHYLDRNSICLGPKYQEIYQSLQQSTQDLAELNDSNSFLTLAITHAVKTLEHSEVDPDWFLQGDGHPLPEQMMTSSGTCVVMPQASTSSQRQERLERYKDSFVLEFFDQVIDEHQQQQQQPPLPLPASGDDRQKSSMSAKRFDPKFRALNEAFSRQADDQDDEEDVEDEVEADGEMPPPTSPKMSASVSGSMNSYPPHPKQRHLSNSYGMHSAGPAMSSSSSSAMHRHDLGIRSDHQMTTDYLQSSNRSDLSVREMNTNYLQTSGSSQRRLPPVVGTGSGSGLPADYFPTTQSMVHDVPFEASSLMVDYDTLDSHVFMDTSDVPTPPTADDDDEEVDHGGAAENVHQPVGSSSSNDVADDEKFFSNASLLLSSTATAATTTAAMANDVQGVVAVVEQDIPLELDMSSAHDPFYVVEGKKQKASKLQRMSSLQENNSVDIPESRPTVVIPEVSPSVITPSLPVTSNRHVKKAKLLAEHQVVAVESHPGDDKLDPSGSDKTRRFKLTLSCNLCSFTTRYKSRLTAHKLRHEKSAKLDGSTKGTTTTTTCPTCDFQTTWKQELVTHMRQTHGGPPFSCSVCNYSSKKLHRLLLHCQIHSITAKFVCAVAGCDFAANTRHKLNFHRQSKHCDPSFKCETCCKSFSTKRTLQTHHLTHMSDSEVKQFSCDECNFTTKYSSHFLLHKKKHRGDVLRCTLDPNCSYSTPKPSHLRNHERIHRGEKPFQCTVCQKSFAEKSQLSRHTKTIHSDAMPFACHRCKFKTKRKDKLKNHLAKIHKENS